MSKFSYVVKDNYGKTYKNVIDAESRKALIEKLQKQDYFIVSITELTSGAKAQDIINQKKNKKKFTHKKVKLADLLAFSRQLATMLEAGVTLIRSLDVINAQVQSAQLFTILSRVKHDVEQGSALSLAISRHPNTFNQFWVSLLEVGEASGTIPIVLNKLAFYLEQQASFQSKIISGIIYPAILFVVAMGAIAFFALFVGPRFEAIFTSMDAKLPLITIILLATFKFIKTFILVIAGIIALIIFGIRKYIQTYHGKLQFERFMFDFPAFGEIYKLIIIERFASQMAILIDAGVPILYSLEISERLVNNNTCALIINSVKEGVKGGQLLVAPMEASGFFPPMFIQMIMVGEETGELSKMLKHIARFYQDNVETFMTRFATIIEPFMLIFMGAVIGTIVVAMFLPMFNIAQAGGAGGGTH